MWKTSLLYSPHQNNWKFSNIPLTVDKPHLQQNLNFLVVARFSLLFACCSLLIARCSLHFARCSLLIACCSLHFSRCSLFSASCSLLFACCLLLFARYSLLFTRCSLLFTCCSLLSARYSLFYARCSLLFTRCSLLFCQSNVWYKLRKNTIEKVLVCVLLQLNVRSTRRAFRIQLLWATGRLLVARVSFVYLEDEFFIFLFMVFPEEMNTWSESKILSCCFCVWCKSRELGGRGSWRFFCVTPVVKSFFSDLRQAIISYWAELHLEICQTSTMETSCENNQRL